MKKLSMALAAATASVALVATPASAYYMPVFDDPETAAVDESLPGWIGKGEVQTLFDLKNKAMQDLVKADAFDEDTIVFTYGGGAEYDVVCEWVTGEGAKGQKPHRKSNRVTAGVVATPDTDPRRNSKGKNGDFTGWYLNLLDYEAAGDEIPNVGDDCHGGGTSGQYVSVDLVAGDGRDAGLYVTIGGVEKMLALSVPAE
jgi:hypothetical protein